MAFCKVRINIFTAMKTKKQQRKTLIKFLSLFEAMKKEKIYSFNISLVACYQPPPISSSFTTFFLPHRWQLPHPFHPFLLEKI